MRVDLTTIRRWAEHIAGECEDGSADAAFLDTLDGETDALDVADALIDAIQSDEALAAGIEDRILILRARRERIKERASRTKSVAVELLDAIGVKKLERPAATISRREGSVSTVIDAPDEVPSQLMRERVTREPDKTAIKKQIEAGEHVPGARLERGPATLSVRAT